MMDSLVAYKHSPEFRQFRTASSPKEHYNGFYLNNLQYLSDLQNAVRKCRLPAHFQDVHQMQRNRCHFAIFQYLQPAFWL